NPKIKNIINRTRDFSCVLLLFLINNCKEFLNDILKLLITNNMIIKLSSMVNVIFIDKTSNG
ncbi:hypothetical protein OV362_25170, partial [Salmonella enterica subsp. enterica serovar 1,4,[5],12:i:-]|nr:hypothetical protein [Salmonella enterica subsp. enterica serovar 1,4,[5],12:i:-]